MPGLTADKKHRRPEQKVADTHVNEALFPQRCARAGLLVPAKQTVGRGWTVTAAALELLEARQGRAA